MTPTQAAWEGFSNAMRLYVESRLRFEELRRVDQEEAVNNMDRAMEAKLEKFHSLYDVTKELPGFTYFAYGDTSVLIALRNALHHRDHTLFRSWNALIGLNNGLQQWAGAAFLLASTTSEDDQMTSRFYYPLHDFYERLKSPKVSQPAKLKSLWDAELRFAEIAQEGHKERYPDKQVFVDLMPAFISAASRVAAWLHASGFQPTGYDGETYFDHFREVATASSTVSYKRLRLPHFAR